MDFKSFITNSNRITKVLLILSYLRVVTIVYNSIYIIPVTLLFIFLLFLAYKNKIKYQTLFNTFLALFIIILTVYIFYLN